MTALLQAWQQGDETALNRLMPLVYEELRRIARNCVYGDRRHQSHRTTSWSFCCVWATTGWCSAIG